MADGPVQARVEEFDEIVQVADTCFPRDKDQGGMLKRWPHVYIPTPEALRNFLLMRQAGAVIAMTAYADQTLTVEGKPLRVAGVTAVATLPEHRGQGMMSTLMTAMNDQMRREGFAFAELGGRRRRYNHFGYDNGTREVRFGFRAGSLRAAETPSGYAVSACAGESADAQATLALHVAEGFGLNRDLDRHRILLARHGWETFVARKDGQPRAYVSVVRGGKEVRNCRVFEFAGQPEAIHALLDHQAAQLGVEEFTVEAPISHPLTPWLFTVSDGWSIVAKRMVKILDLAAVLDGFAEQMRRRYAESGAVGRREFSVQVGETGQTARVLVTPEEAVVEPGRAAAAHFELGELEMVRFLFGLAGPDCVVGLDGRNGFLRSILPLDFYVWSLEQV